MKRAAECRASVAAIAVLAACTNETIVRTQPRLLNLCAATGDCPAGTSCVATACRVDDGGWCIADGDCVHVCVDGVCCISRCDGPCQSCSSDGACIHFGGSCDDADACTAGDTCSAGQCVGGAMLTPACASLADQAPAIGIDPVGAAHGVAFADFDNDGDLDLFLGREDTQPALLYRNAGGNFTDTGILTAPARGGFFADPDNDGDLDLMTTNTTAFFENDGAGQFNERTVSANLGADNLGSVVWIDYNADGYIDLYFPNGTNTGVNDYNEMRRNNGDVPVTFTSVSGASLGLDVGSSNGETSTGADIDNDGDVDLWYNDDGDGSLYVNDFVPTGAPGFTESAAAAGLAIDMTPPPPATPATVQPYYAVAFGDYDNDGWIDLFLGHPDGNPNRLYHNDGDGTFTRTSGDGTDVDLGDTRGASWGDVDNDGDLDLLLGNEGTARDGAGAVTGIVGRANVLLRNDGSGGFSDIAPEFGIAGNAPTKGVALVDFDHDGDLDIYMANGENDASAAPNTLWRNPVDDTNYLEVKVEGGGPPMGSPRDGTGSRVELWDESGTQLLARRDIDGGGGYACQLPALVHFGLSPRWGGGAGLYQVKVFFTRGTVRNVRDVVPLDENLTIGTTTLANTIEIDETVP